MASARDVAAKALGKPLPAGCEVHHINQDAKDNRPQNLVICQDKAYHHFLHARMRAKGLKKPYKLPSAYIFRGIDDDLWRKCKGKAALEGRTMRQVIMALIDAWLNPSQDIGTKDQAALCAFCAAALPHNADVCDSCGWIVGKV